MLNRVLTKICGVAMFLLMFFVVLQVFMRYVVHSPLSWTEEFSRVLLVWFSMIGTYIASRQNRHLGIEAIRKLTGTIGEQIGFVFESILILLFVGILVWQGFKYCQLSLRLQQSFVSVDLPKAIVYIVFPSMGILIWIHTLRQLITFFVEKGKVPGRNTEVL